MKTTQLMVGLALAASVAAAAEVGFAAKPTAAREGEAVKITFAVSQPSDVEAAVLDAKGVVVRHLAAGLLGGASAPPAPLAAGLSQSLVWDGKDDLGRPATGGPFKARVRAGMRVKFGAALGEPEALGSKVYGLATDEKGQLYAATGGGYGDNVFTIKVFDRKGKYLRTIFPYPPSLKPADVEGFGKPTLRDGRLCPPQFHSLLPWIYPHGIGGLMGSRVEKGILWLTNGRGEVCRIRAADGACISWGGTESPAPPAQGPICWAASPDGSTLFLAGWYRRDRKIADGQVFKVDPATGRRSTFAQIEVPPDNFWEREKNGWYNYTNWGRKNGLSALHGLAVDEAGRVYVCDRVNQRLAVYGASGTLLGSTPVGWPDLVALGPKGAIYVTTRRIVDGYRAVNEVKVLKLSGWKDGRVVAALLLAGHQAPSMALDASAEPPVLWLSNVAEGRIDPQKKANACEILRIEDRGGRLVVAKGKLGGEARMPEAVVKVWADPRSDDIAVNDAWNGLSRYDGLTGERKPFPLTGIDFAFGPDGLLYVYGQKGWHELVARFDRDFKPFPFPATGKNATTLATTGKDVYGRYGHGWSNKGICVAPSGRLYVHNMYDWCKYYVNVWDPEGKAEKHPGPGDGLVGPTDPEGGGLCVDAAGNLYVGLHGAPAGSPAAADKRRSLGSVVKFGPDGGGYAKVKSGSGSFQEGIAKPELRDEKGEKGIAWTGSAVGNFVRGALAAYPLLGPQSAGGCVCREARFDLDGYGRLYIPNGLDYYVRILDNAGNEILQFGYYGNPDSRGPESAVPEPEIPLGWPDCVAAGQVERGRLYVADTMNRRVVRVAVTFAAEATCPLE